MKTLHIKKGDTVKILAGDDKGKTGKVIMVMPNECKVVVEGINMMKRHERPRKQGQKGQVVEKAMPIHASNVALKDKKAKAVKVVKPKAKTVKAKAK
jgi:large subunit ribosomal protein L24